MRRPCALRIVPLLFRDWATGDNAPCVIVILAGPSAIVFGTLALLEPEDRWLYGSIGAYATIVTLAALSLGPRLVAGWRSDLLVLSGTGIATAGFLLDHHGHVFRLVYVWAVVYAALFLPSKRFAAQTVAIVAAYATAAGTSGLSIDPVDDVLPALVVCTTGIVVHLVALGLRRSRDAVSEVIQAIPEPVVLVDREGSVRLWNRAATRMFGWSADEALASPNPVVPADLSHDNARLFAAVLDGVPVRNMHRERTSKTGARLDVLVSAAPLWSRHGSEAAIVTYRDVSVQYAAEREARFRGEQFRAVWEQSLDAKLVLDDDARIIDANPAAEALTGRPRDELMGMHAVDLVPERRRAQARENWVRFLRRGEWKALATIVREDGEERWVSTLGRTRILENRNLVSMIDVTEQILAERELRETDKLDAIGQLATGIAHDFNNSLLVITGYAKLISESVPASAAAHDAEQIARAADEAAALVRRLLDFAQSKHSEPVAVDPHGQLLSTIEVLAHTLGSSIAIEVALDPETPHVLLGQYDLARLVLNLATNARDAMPAGGTLRIDLRPLTVGGPDIRRHDLQPGAYAQLTVSDTGEGMDESVLARAADPFFTTKTHATGTGLGLANVQRIVHKAGGTLTISSVVGEGTTVQIVLPTVTATAQSASGAEVKPDEPRAAGPTILFIDDEEAIRTLVRRVLEGHGFDVLTACDTAEGRLLASRDAAHIDLVITDVVMPDGNGFDLAAELEESLGIPVLCVSGEVNPAEVEGRCEHFLPKPFSVDTLVQAARDLLAA